MADTKEAVNQATIITYGEKIIESLEPGETCTIRCKGNIMKDDIIVKAAEIDTTQLTTIRYGEKFIEALIAGQTGTIRCKGKKLKNDIIVKAAEIENLPSAKLEDVKSVYFSSNIALTIVPSEGYDGMKGVRVVVDVPSETVEEYDGTMVIS